MSLSPSAQTVYKHLITQVLPTRKVTTYGDIEKATGVPIGKGGGNIGKVLGEIARACHERELPPLSSIVVLASSQYDLTGRHGMPGTGYFTMQAEFDDAFADWAAKPAPVGFDKDADRWKLQKTVEAHQDAVWKKAVWPSSL